MSESDTETTVTTPVVADKLMSPYQLHPPPSFLSLPDEIIMNCLARISRSYHPKLCLVSKTFRSLILSNELYAARLQLKTTEVFFHVCLKLSSCHRPSWYVLRTKPDQTLTDDLEIKYASIGNALLVPIPSDSPEVPFFTLSTASEDYALLDQSHAPSCAMSVREKGFLDWREAPKMTLARASAFAAVLDGKIYVVGGCDADETANWAEVFDTKTQHWESLPDPGPKLRLSKIKKAEGIGGKLYVMTTGYDDFVYDPEVGKWEIGTKGVMTCTIENVRYCSDGRSVLWWDTKRNEWRLVRGLAILGTRYNCGEVEIAAYDGKLLVLWDEVGHLGMDAIGSCRHKKIWCAVIAFERHNDDDEVWGNIEWANLVLRVPSSYVFLRTCLVSF